jgi:FkbM family methyltransferase
MYEIKKKISRIKRSIVKKIYSKYFSWKFDIFNDYLNRKGSDIFFIQIGSNDGIVDDILYERIIRQNYKGILVEPVPYLFDKLKKNYNQKYKNLIFENIAIGNMQQKLPFYRLDVKSQDGVTIWYEGLGSFKKNVLLKHKNAIPNFDNLLMTDLIDLITFHDLIRKHDISYINLLQIDTEGYEFEIISSIDFSIIKIEIILFEHKHLSCYELKLIRKKLKNNGFIVKRYNDFDSLAIDRKIFSNLYNL